MVDRASGRALRTQVRVLSVLAALPDRDHAIDVLIGAIEEDRARLLASTMGLPEREPMRVLRAFAEGL
jgi:hypothetical protein